MISFWLTAAIGFLAVIADGDPMVFVNMGTERTAPQQFNGYDGQFAYAIAKDPLGARDSMDIASLRYQRILYPVLAWAFSFGGQEALLPWVLLGINLVAAVVSTVVFGELLFRRGVSRWYGLVLSVFYGMVFAVFMDLNEPLSIVLVLVAIYWLDEKKFVPVLIAFGLAPLAKESVILFPIGYAFWLFIQGDRKAGVRALCIGVLPGVFWAFLISLWTAEPQTSLLSLFRIVPFSGLSAVRGPSFLLLALVQIVLPIVLLVFAVGRQLLKREHNWLTWVLLGTIAFFAILPYATWGDLIAPYRLMMQVIVPALLFTAGENRFVFRLLAWNWGLSMVSFAVIA